MHRTLKNFAIAALLASGLSGCSDFLSGPSVDIDPNNPDPAGATAGNLFAAFQAGQFSTFAGSEMAITICGYVQQCKGINGRHVQTQLVEYNTSPQTLATAWDQTWRNGGLRDIRLAQEILARAPDDQEDQLYAGIIKVWEALVISEAADKWGDIPYSQAANAGLNTPGAPPPLDDQIAVYTATLALLDEAIALIAQGDTEGDAGPGVADFNFGGAAASWTAVAHTLKARIRLHTLRHPAVCGPAISGCSTFLTEIVNEATLGIPLGAAGDNSADVRVVVNGRDIGQSNGWYQFYGSSGFDDDLRVGDFFATLIQTRGPGGTPDPRAAEFLFDPGDGGGFFIARDYAFEAADPAFQHTWVSGDENALILAEAQFRNGDAAGALVNLNAVRAKYGLPALGAATLPAIMEEKYVALFQNWEVWNDWKRTGCPAITSTSTQTLGPEGAAIPRRVYYGQQEQDINPNIPKAGEQTGAGGPNLPDFRNENDPLPDPVCA